MLTRRLATLSFAAAVAFGAAAVDGNGVAAAPAETLAITTASGPHRFEVEVMRTDAEREKGLMFRKTMPADHGMLFDFDVAQPVMMWMKNTYLPLDMVFIGADGRVISTAENAVPMSEDIISSHGSALGVLELNAGIVAKYGVKAGDRVANPMFPK